MSDPGESTHRPYRMPPEQVKDELGKVAYEELDHFREHLGSQAGKSPADNPARIAPSIIARSEAELFAISVPRFAIRLSPDHNGSLANLRRFNEFANSLKGATWPYYAGVASESHRDFIQDPGNPNVVYIRDTSEKPYDVIANQRKCIADSLLVPSKQLRKKYHVITVDLGHAYGEQISIDGTPYVQHLQYSGGGLCAQAACYMANTILHDHPPDRFDCCSDTDETMGAQTAILAGTLEKPPIKRAVSEHYPGMHGVAEITAIVADDDDTPLKLKGLTWAQIRSYFHKIGRNASAQKQVGERRFAAQHAQAFFAATVRGYIRSNMPLILPVNVELCAHPKATQSSTPSDTFRPELNHAVVIVGCTLPLFDKPENQSFLINNPATMPFCPLTLPELWNCCYREKSGPPGVTRSWPMLIAVTPSSVQLPLHTRFEPEGRKAVKNDGEQRGDAYAGLLDIAHLFQIQRKDLASHLGWNPAYPQIPDSAEYRIGEFQLLTVRWPAPAIHRDWIAVVPDYERDALWECWKKSPIGPRLDGRWCWLEYRQPEPDCKMPPTLWIWDAQKRLNVRLWSNEDRELTLENIAQLETTLLAVLAKDPRTSQWTHRYNRSEGFPIHQPQDSSASGTNTESEKSNSHASTPAAAKPTSPPPLAISLITSFCPGGSHEATIYWPTLSRLNIRDLPPVACELYCFMHHDPILDLLMPSGGHRLSALKRMAKFAKGLRPINQPEFADRLRSAAATVSHWFNERHRSPIVALASYLPEFSSRTADDAIDALAFLIDFARALRKGNSDGVTNPVTVIELVAGSSVRGVWRGTEYSPIGAKRNPVYFALREPRTTVIRRLCANLASAITRAKLQPGEGIALALELEPGPLYVLNNLESLKLLDDIIHERHLDPYVAYNLDVAHWEIAGIRPDLIPDRIASRIVHAHISDHGLGHFGDVALGEANLGRGAGRQEQLQAFLPWLKFLARIWHNRPKAARPPVSGHVSIEMEASYSAKPAYDSVEVLWDLLSKCP